MAQAEEQRKREERVFCSATAEKKNKNASFTVPKEFKLSSTKYEIADGFFAHPSDCFFRAMGHNYIGHNYVLLPVFRRAMALSLSRSHGQRSAI